MLPSDSQGCLECSISKRALVLLADFYSRHPGVVKKNSQYLASGFSLASSLEYSVRSDSSTLSLARRREWPPDRVEMYEVPAEVATVRAPAWLADSYTESGSRDCKVPRRSARSFIKAKNTGTRMIT